MRVHYCFNLASVVLALSFGAAVETRGQERAQSAPVLVSGAPLGATASTDPPPRVRVLTAAAERVVGTLVEINDDEIILLREGASGPSVFARPAIAKVEIVDGNKRGRHAFIGGAILAVAAIGATFSEAHVDPGLRVAAALIAAPVGACLGAALPPGEAWREIRTVRRAERNVRNVAFRVSIRF